MTSIIRTIFLRLTDDVGRLGISFGIPVRMLRCKQENGRQPERRDPRAVSEYDDFQPAFFAFRTSFLQVGHARRNNVLRASCFVANARARVSDHGWPDISRSSIFR